MSEVIKEESTFKRPKFNNSRHKEFADALKQEVNSYFSSRGINKSGGYKFLLKVPVVLGLYLVPYFIILFADLNWVSNLFLALLMGIGMTATGLVVMHDANHKNASSFDWLNKPLTYSLNLFGGSPVLWRIQHNVLHHTYTNVEHFDEDIHNISLLRFSPNAKLKWIHRYQHLYAWFFYSLLTINWTGHDDYIQLKRYHKQDLLKSQKASYWREVVGITLTKILYHVYLILIPILITDIPWWQIIIGYVAMHMVAGLLLSLIFQAAHVTSTSEYLETENLQIEENWLVHQLKNTRNFGAGSRIFTWFVGGLNHQVEHHLFPNISHVHYSRIAKIVKQVAAKYEIPYYEARTFVGAVRDHFLFLRQLGRA